jgi:hypothetical protein
MPGIQVTTGGGNVVFEHHPETCPICHNVITPNPLWSTLSGKKLDAGLRVLYSCPNLQCQEVFIAYFAGKPGQQYRFVTSRPTVPRPITFSEEIRKMSESFTQIYTEAHKAEEMELTQICGVGYRKALEFLIKDYSIGKHPDDKDKIVKSMLGQCIENYVSDARIKNVAKRATWLGNDETHYERRWMDKDLGDLKLLISLTTHWIEMEKLTEAALASMPAS